MFRNFFLYIFWFVFLACFQLVIYAQAFEKKDSVKIVNPKWNDYFFTKNNSSIPIFFDSSFTLKKMFHYNNFLQKDLFGKIPFSNIGSPLNNLIYFPPKIDIHMIPSGKSENFISIESVRYFNVKTPTTEFSYNNGILEGHSLRTTFTRNIHSRWNYALEYYALRSQGKYFNELAVNNSILISSNYQVKNNNYQVQGHYLKTNINNQENGGILNLSDLISNNSNVKHRNRLTVNLLNAQSKFHYRRYFLEQFLRILYSKKNDVLKKEYFLRLKNTTFFEFNDFNFSSNSYNNILNSKQLIQNISKDNMKNFTRFSNITSIQSRWKNIFLIEMGLRLENINFYFGQDFTVNNFFIPSGFCDKRVGFISNFQFHHPNSKIDISADAGISKGFFFKRNSFLNSNLEYLIEDNYLLSGKFNFQSLSPNLNLVANQFFYSKYNYLLDFDNETIIQLSAFLSSKKHKTHGRIDIFNINNYIFLNKKGKLEQISSLLSIIQFHLNSEINYKKFAVNSRITYQQIDKFSTTFLPFPNFIARITLYYQSVAFKKNATLQSGIRGYYFSQFNSRVFNPVLNEFQLQNSMGSIGSYPIIDIFFNIKVKRMQIFLEAQHFNSAFSKDFRADPLRPFTDFHMNFGIHWLIFN